jgi:SAM-dependent methyltransferase
VYQDPLEDLAECGGYDVVLMWSVLDHFFDPIAALKKCHGLLRPGGHIYIGNVNVDGFDHRIMGLDSITFGPPGRVNYYGQRSLAAHLRLAGFDLVETATPGMLDVDIVRDYWRRGGANGYNEFLAELILKPEALAAAEGFQRFLREHQLAGYQTVLARRGN